VFPLFIKHEYSRDPGIVTSILQELELQALQERSKTSRLLVFHKITHQKVAIPLPPYLFNTKIRVVVY
jgi:hypothetical protein